MLTPSTRDIQIYLLYTGCLIILENLSRGLLVISKTSLSPKEVHVLLYNYSMTCLEPSNLSFDVIEVNYVTKR